MSVSKYKVLADLAFALKKCVEKYVIFTFYSFNMDKFKSRNATFDFKVTTYQLFKHAELHTTYMFAVLIDGDMHCHWQSASIRVQWHYSALLKSDALLDHFES